MNDGRMLSHGGRGKREGGEGMTVTKRTMGGLREAEIAGEGGAKKEWKRPLSLSLDEIRKEVAGLLLSRW